MILTIFTIIATLFLTMYIIFFKPKDTKLQPFEKIVYILLLIATIFCIIKSCKTQINLKQDYTKYQLERMDLEEDLIYYLANNPTDVNVLRNDGLRKDCVDFNNRLRDHKRFIISPVTSWFGNKLIAQIGYLDSHKILRRINGLDEEIKHEKEEILPL